MMMTSLHNSMIVLEELDPHPTLDWHQSEEALLLRLQDSANLKGQPFQDMGRNYSVLPLPTSIQNLVNFIRMASNSRFGSLFGLISYTKYLFIHDILAPTDIVQCMDMVLLNIKKMI